MSLKIFDKIMHDCFFQACPEGFLRLGKFSSPHPFFGVTDNFSDRNPLKPSEEMNH